MKELLLILMIGTAAMMLPMLLVSKRYGIKAWKIVPISIILTIVGTFGTYLMYFLENGEFGGRSFYGAVFLVPIVFVIFPKIFRITYAELMDLCAPAECIMLVLMKYKCLQSGCCKGKYMGVDSEGIPVFFPSQIAELITALIVGVILVLLAYKVKNRGLLYPWYLILYGSTRFVLNIFREEWVYKDSLLPIGNIWSICAVIIGLLALALIMICNNRASKKQRQTY